jgi:hypothetical protein
MRGAAAVVEALAAKAVGDERFASVGLEQLVTAETVAAWDLGELAELIRRARLGICLDVDYMSPSWARVYLPLGVEERTSAGGRTLALAAYVRFDDGVGWRVHALGGPNLELDELRASRRFRRIGDLATG